MRAVQSWSLVFVFACAASLAMSEARAVETQAGPIWNNMDADGQPNPHTLHQGTPVTSGAKAIVTKWFRRPRA